MTARAISAAPHWHPPSASASPTSRRWRWPARSRRWARSRPTRRTGFARRISSWRRAPTSNDRAATGAAEGSSMADEKKKGGWAPLAVAGLLGLAIGGGGMFLARGGGGISENRVGEIVHNYLLENPEVLPAAMDELERKQSAAAVAPRRAAFETP